MSEGEDAVDRPEKLNSGSSEMVCVAKTELSIAVASICRFLSPPRANTELRHSSVIGRGVIEPVRSSCDSESSSLSNENDGAGAVKGEAVPPKREGELEPCVLPLVIGGVESAS